MSALETWPAGRRLLVGALVAAAGLALASIGASGLHLPDLVAQSRLVTAIGIPKRVGLALGQGGETVGLQLAFGLLVGVTIARSLSWAAPWYVLWILPSAALRAGRRLRATVVMLGAYLILAFMPAAALLPGDAGFRPANTCLGVHHTHEIAAVFR